MPKKFDSKKFLKDRKNPPSELKEKRTRVSKKLKFIPGVPSLVTPLGSKMEELKMKTMKELHSVAKSVGVKLSVKGVQKKKAQLIAELMGK